MSSQKPQRIILAIRKIYTVHDSPQAAAAHAVKEAGEVYHKTSPGFLRVKAALEGTPLTSACLVDHQDTLVTWAPVTEVE